MATLAFVGTDRKVFTPISSALSGLPNGAATVIVFVKRAATTGGADIVGLTDSGPTNWYHTLGLNSSNQGFDDDGLVGVIASSGPAADTTNWWWRAVDWAGGAAGLERFHFRNHTGGGSFTHSNSAANNGGMRAGPGTSGWLRIGSYGDDLGDKSIAIVAIWAGTRFSDSDYGTWTKTSDLANHPLGPPTFLCELTATTLVDLMSGSTFSSGSSSGTTLTGADPDSFTFDGLGGGAVAVPCRQLILPKRLGPRAVGPLFFAPWRTAPDVAVPDATVVVGTGSATADGTAVAAKASSTVAVGTGSATVDGTAVATKASSTAAVGTGSATADGTAASAQASTTVVVGTGSATADGTAATPVPGTKVAVGTGGATADGTAVASAASSTAQVGTGSAAASGTAAGPQASSKAAVGTGSAVADGTAVATKASSTAVVGTGTATADGTSALPGGTGSTTVSVGTGSATAGGTAATPVVQQVVVPAPGPTGGRYEPGGDETSIYPETVDATVRVGPASAWASGTRAVPVPSSGFRFRLPFTRPKVNATVPVGAASAVASGAAVALRVSSRPMVGTGSAVATGTRVSVIREMRVEDAERMRDEAVAAVLLLSDE